MEEERLLTPRERAFLERNPEAEMSSEPKRLEGVSGWLGFLVLSMIFLGPFFTVVMTWIGHSDTETIYPEIIGSNAWKTALTIDWSSVVAYAAVSIVGGLLLLRRFLPSTVYIAIFCLWLSGPAITILTIWLAESILGNSATAQVYGSSLGRPLVYATVWTFYLLRSRRVRNTYFRDR